MSWFDYVEAEIYFIGTARRKVEWHEPIFFGRTL